MRWIYSTDARDIGMLYLINSGLAGLIGTTMSILIRMQLMDINQSAVLGLTNQMYNNIITVHAIVMIFFLVMPAMFGGFGNIFLPILIGSLDMAKKKFKRYIGYIQNNNSNNKYFNSYLSGLWEGDGHIYIKKTKNKLYPVWAISLNSKDKPLALKLISLIGGKGHIINHSKKGLELRFTNLNDIIKIIYLTNGYYRTPKIYQVHRLIDFLNNQNPNLNIPKLEINNTPLFSDSWFAGFIDADGCFYIRFSDKQISCKFSLEQRMFCPVTNKSYGLVFKQIQQEFNCKLYTRSRQKINKSYYNIKIESVLNNKILIDYLTIFPLYSSKYNDFINYVKAFNIILKKKDHLTDLGRKKIFLLKSTMNDKRTTFDWNHLKNLNI